MNSTYFSGGMPKDPSKKTVQAHLSKEEYEAFRKEADKHQWSDKRLTENIIRWYLEAQKKKT